MASLKVVSNPRPFEQGLSEVTPLLSLASSGDCFIGTVDDWQNEIVFILKELIEEKI